MLAAGWFGTLPAWLTVIGLLIAAATFTRGSRSTAITNLRAERDELEREVKRQHERNTELLAENVKLTATRDLAPLQAAMVEALGQHEARAADRHDKTMIVLDLIAERLGPNAGH